MMAGVAIRGDGDIVRPNGAQISINQPQSSNQCASIFESIQALEHLHRVLSIDSEV